MMFERIYGATPILDASDLKLEWVKSQEDLNKAEIENISRAINKYLMKRVAYTTAWMNTPFLLKVHLEMFNQVWQWAGKFRKTSVMPVGVQPYQISLELETLCSDVLYWDVEGVEMTILQRAAQLHHRLVCIHPFSNGNGRFSRLISDRYLKAWKCKPPRWPVDLAKEGNSRKEYIYSLREADQGDYVPLIRYMKKYNGECYTKDTFQNSWRNTKQLKTAAFEKTLKAYQTTELVGAIR